jgi:4'-phosphopantetheinyl transferase
MALFVVARGREVGVDVEQVHSDSAHLEIARHFFSPWEAATLRALPPDVQAQAFFNCWTRKEAYIKARGEGLSHPLHVFEVSLMPGEKAVLRRNRRDPLEVTRWSMQDLFLSQNYKAAIVVEGGGYQLKCWQWRALGVDAEQSRSTLKITL